MKSSRSLFKLFPSLPAGFTMAEQLITVGVIGIFAAITAPNLIGMLDRVKVEQAMTEVRSALDETQREAIRGNKVCSVTLNFVNGIVSGSCLRTGNRSLPKKISIATNLIEDAAITEDLNKPIVATAPDQQSVATDTAMILGVSDQQDTQVAMLSPEDQASKAHKAGMVVQIIASKACKSKGKGIKNCKEPEGAKSGGPLSDLSAIPVQFGVLGNPKFTIAVPVGVSLPNDPSGKIVLYLADRQEGEKKCIAISQSLGLTRAGNYEGPLTPTNITSEGTCTAMNWQKQ